MVEWLGTTRMPCGVRPIDSPPDTAREVAFSPGSGNNRGSDFVALVAAVSLSPTTRNSTMQPLLRRREFLKTSTVAAAGMAIGGFSLPSAARAQGETDEPLFRISLAEWSLHKELFGGEMTNLDFPAVAKNDLGIDAVEYVNQFFKDKAKDTNYLSELKNRCDDLGVRSVLIMCDGEGQLGDPDERKRIQAVENHYRWVEAAKFLGCHSIRVNAASSGSRQEQQDRAADGLAKLGDFADQHGINVLVENHGGLSSDGAWLAAVMEQVGRPNVGTLPDFGNFYEYDRYQGVKELMPYAKAVSAKSKEFDDSGNTLQTDFRRMMTIVLDAGYHGYVGIEWEGAEPNEREGIRLTRDLLVKIRDEMS
jgi:L-ribulose-5-phosphate 3-epimerase